ncbi:MAG TPA: zinc-binding dehydrogenase [Alphaproteobacteria bacterium]|jgi:NADPH:quinone reductase-like Zn-dependent oxidoreductase|nr:zinc-binding dehydrogenase [Alphaproteobacteria bacterium]
MTASWLGPVKQISYTTDNVDRMVEFWENQVGIGPWSIFRGLTLTMEFEGRQIAMPVNVGLSVHGGVLIELMQVMGNGPSPFHDNLNRPIIGLQRLAAASDDIEADNKAALERGMEMFASGRDATGQRYTYFRSSLAPGVILELLENIPSFGTFVSGLEARTAAYRNAVAKAAEATPLGLPGTMIAAEIGDYGGEFAVGTVAEPVPGPGEIRVKVAGAAVNPVDVKARRGILKAWMPLSFPARLGGDVAGTVDAVGAGVGDFQVGDRVMGMINPMANGAYAEKVVFYAGSFAKVPDGMEMTDAAALPTGVMTGIQLVEKGIAPKPGSKGIVVGAGGSTGRAAVLAALDAGAVVYAGVRASSRDAVADLPVAGVIDLSDAAALKAAGPFDFMADTVGGETAERLFAYLKPNGIVCSIAVPPPNPPPGSTQRFSSLIVTFDRPRLERFARDLKDKGRCMPVAHTLPLAKVAVAHGLMEQGGVGGKIVLVP